MKRKFLPGAHFDSMTRFYDFGSTLLNLGKGYRAKVQKHVRLGQKVLDAGCGTGSLAVDFAKKYTTTRMHAVDADTRMLNIAKNKAVRNSAHIAFQHGYLQKLPYPNNTFDTVYSSLVFHHLPKRGKQEALKEIRRVLKKGGKFYLIDVGKPSSVFSLLPRFAALFEEGKENVNGELFRMIKAQFHNVEDIARLQHDVRVV